MSLYAVKNDKGDYLNGVAGEKPLFGGLDKDCVLNGEDAGWWADRGYGQVIELVEKPAPIVVSEEEDKVLKKAKNTTVWRPASVIAKYAYEHERQADDEVLMEDRLMRSYVNGWTVEKPKRYVLPMEGTKLADGTIAYATLDHTGVWTIKAYSKKQSAVAFHNTVTQAEIDAAPDWVKAITPAEVTDDD